jgi:hypothetical protein
MQGNGISLHILSIYVKHSIIPISNNLPMPNALHSCTLYLQYYERTYTRTWRVKCCVLSKTVLNVTLFFGPSHCTVTVL